MAEYAILDELKEQSDERLQKFMETQGVMVVSKISEIEEPFDGSDPDMRLFIFSNYMSKRGLVNLAIIIREHKREKNENEEGGTLSVKSDVETSIFPMYFTNNQIFDLPEKVESPEITPKRASFILEKRSLPKKKKGEIFDPSKHKWTINLLAAELNMSNRLVAQYCKSLEI